MFQQLFEQFGSMRVAVVGDVMLDTYWHGSTERISPEAPVPIVNLQRKEYRPGGAANVALNLVMLGAKADLYAVLGQDEDAEALQTLLQARHIGCHGMVQSADRQTTHKVRIISRSQHVLRLDKEDTFDLTLQEQANFLSTVLEGFKAQKPHVVILQDYNKGVLTTEVIGQLISYCKQHDIITTVDPKRKNFFDYQGVDIFKPNLKEVTEALQIIGFKHTQVELSQIDSQLRQKLAHHITLLTLSEKGMYWSSGSQAESLPAHIRNIADVSGAGDTVIAVASLVYAATKNIHLAAEVANLAGGIVCEEVGTVPIMADKLYTECLLNLKEEK